MFQTRGGWGVNGFLNNGQKTALLEDEGTPYLVMKVILWWKLSSDESFQVMKVILWWKFAIDEIYLVMEVILWWKLSNDESYLVMRVI